MAAVTSIPGVSDTIRHWRNGKSLQCMGEVHWLRYTISITYCWAGFQCQKPPSPSNASLKVHAESCVSAAPGEMELSKREYFVLVSKLLFHCLRGSYWEGRYLVLNALTAK